MSNRLRFRSGQVQLQRVRVDSETVIEAGDLVFLDGDDAKPAADFTWDTDLATTQAGFAAVFLGVAHQPSPAGEAEPISVDVSPFSVYEFDVAASTYEVGDLLGPDSVGTALQSQQCEAVASSGLAIGRAVEYRATSSLRLRVSFASAFHAASANVNAAVG
ncbi:capsid cement protein [Rubinisphaera brasiliensis]|uniref:Uncharacterized protein n=1 Tax=Rubinisphaera brasiliensis (strain ATCC 49424 / DSM 5305 / JCM 21570 / IAM 15109 / NBRC 103401 / IFAM 1448) TaxID=756272 RepID=F0SLQ1_RUBBR|nr:capsid cement protein [Rubinisphaera brasiliensis]ADY58792.1 hypothetical protein Plabr_1176 [Rubinisphaera brasiliensis DSM 5305]